MVIVTSAPKCVLQASKGHENDAGDAKVTNDNYNAMMFMMLNTTATTPNEAKLQVHLQEDVAQTLPIMTRCASAACISTVCCPYLIVITAAHGNLLHDTNKL